MPGYASALRTFAEVRVAARRERDAALSAVLEATMIYQRLADERPAVFADSLSDARSTTADVLDALGRADETP